jgi:predicted HicB family RNase H-like nuclease
MARVEIDGTSARLGTRVPTRLYGAVRLAALEADVTVSDWITDALETHLRRCRGPRPLEPPRDESA